MKLTFKFLIALGLISAASIMGLLVEGARLEAHDDKDFEVWATDQSGTAGKLHIYNGEDLIDDPNSAVAEVIDLGGAVSTQCTTDTGSTPTRAHIVLFNSTHTVAILAYVASGHVVFIDAATRTPIKCIRMSPGDVINPATGEPFRQAHAAFPARNDQYVVVANQNGRLLERINTNADGDGTPYENAADIVHDTDATLHLVSCTTNTGVPCQQAGVRPTNNVICPIVDDTSTLTFITLSGGGLLVANTSTGGAPPPIVADYDLTTIHGNGCGGMQASTQASGRIYINSGAFTGNPDESDLYSFPADVASYSSNLPNTPSPTLVYSFDGVPPVNDSHGMTLVTRKKRVLWVGDRATNEIQVVNTRKDKLVNTFSLVSKASSDPAPDLMAVDPKSKYAFIALRGPCPLTANDPTVNNAVGNTPGVMVVKRKRGGFIGKVVGVARITDPAPAAFDCTTRTDDTPDGLATITERADPHGIAVRSL
ncbi:MAG: hypothetical protein ACREXY_03845 [Gammaproteobacteria bacterium]